jgi:hypothetical protein
MRMRTPNLDNKLEFRKKIGKDIHNFQFKKLIEHLIKDIQEEGFSQDDDSCESQESNDDY